MEHYFKTQRDLCAVKSDFFCPGQCDAPGCVLDEVVVEATLFDLMRMSLRSGLPVSELFSRHCRLGLQNSEFNPRYLRFLIKLNKPCPFFKGRRCVVHDSKPLNCALFPEFHQIKGLLPAMLNIPVFHGFPCLKKEIAVSRQRADALKMLRSMSRKEEGLSFYHLFEEPLVIVDAKPLTRRFKKKRPQSALSIRDYERLLEQELGASGFFDGIFGKISLLDRPEVMRNLFEQLEDNALIKNLSAKMETPEVVYRVKQGRLKKSRRFPRRTEAALI